jgi:hypothetical protein
MAGNKVSVEFLVDSEGRGRAALSEIHQGEQQLKTSAASTTATLSSEAQAYEEHLVKAGVASARARSEAEKYQEVQKAGARTATRAAGEEARAAELSSAQQKAAAESLQRQRTSSLLAEMKDRERAYAKDAERFLAAENEKKKLAGHRLTDMSRFDDPAGAGAGAGGGAGGRSGGSGEQHLPRGLSSAAGFAGSQLGLPGLGTLTTSLGAGGLVAGGGVGLAAFVGIRELIKLDLEAEQAELNLSVAARGTGRSFGEAKSAAEEFRTEMAASREEAVALAKSFGELQLRTGEFVKAGDVAKLTTLANAQGLKPEDAARALSELSQGKKEGLSALTGETDAQAQLLLDNYARSVGTVTSKLTEMERAQVLSNEALKRSGEFTGEAARRMATLDTQATSLKEKLKDLASEYGRAFYHGVILNESADDTYKREAAEADQQSIADNRRLQQAAAAKAAQAEINRREKLTRELDQSIEDRQRGARALPEDYQRGATPQQREAQNIQRLRDQRAAAQAQLEEFADKKPQYSPEDAKRFEQQLKDEVQTFTDQIRAAVEAQHQALEQAVTGARNSLKSFLADAAIARDRDNPFVSLFVKGRLEVEETRKQFLVFGREFADEMARIKQSSIDSEIALARFHSRLSAVKDLQEARRLEQPIVGLSGPQERRLSTIQAQITDVNRQADLTREINYLENPYRRSGSFERGQDFGRQLRELQRLDTSGAGRGGEKAQADAILALTGQIDARTLATSGDPTIRAARAARIQALKIEREQSSLDVRETVQRERAGNQLQTNAREQLRTLSGAGGLTDQVKLREFLAITSTLSDKELTGDLRLGRASALRESARQDGEQEKRARAQERLLFGDGARDGGVIGRLNQLISDRGLRVDAGPAATVNISSKDVGASRAQLGPAMTPAPAPAVPGYAPGFRE